MLLPDVFCREVLLRPKAKVQGALRHIGFRRMSLSVAARYPPVAKRVTRRGRVSRVAIVLCSFTARCPLHPGASAPRQGAP